VPAPAADAAALFVTAVDTHPLAADPAVVIAGQQDAFALGLDLLAKLLDGPVYLCKAAGSDIPAGSDASIEVHEFAGPHPAGLAGTHINLLRGGVTVDKPVWTIGYQDVIAIGRTFLDGKL